MTKLIAKFGPILILIAISGALAPVYRAQVNSATRVITVPDGLYYKVDGREYQHAMSAMWPVGSQHILWVDQTVQDNVVPKVKFTFLKWDAAETALEGNRISITATPYITEYRALFDTQYALTFVFTECAGVAGCRANGSITVNGENAVSSDQDVYLPVGSAARLVAVPKDGYVFAGWQPAAGQLVVGLANTVSMKTPVTVYPRFVPARNIAFETFPRNLQLLVDRSLIRAPWSFPWGWDSVHTIDVVSPQMDGWGKMWIFKSWSDGGASQHAYRVPSLDGPVTLTATFDPGVPINIRTSPQSLPLAIDGLNSPPPYYFLWLAGDTHRLEAPAQQTDGQGRIWTFAGWSNGVTGLAQDFQVPVEDVWLTATYQLAGHLTVNGALANLTVKVDGADCALPCDIRRPVGTEVRISAPPSLPLGEGARADFAGWTGSATAGSQEWVATLNGEPQAIWANYRTMNRLSTLSDPSAGASWAISPPSPDGYYDSQTVVSVGATASPGYRFRRWGGDLSGTDSPAAVRMDAPRVVQALLDRSPYIVPAGVLNGAGPTPQAGVAAGSVVSVFGASLSAETLVGRDSPLTQTLAGLTVRVGDRLAPLFFVSPGQLNLQLPADLPAGRQTLTVSSQELGQVSADFTVVRTAPGLFQQTANDLLVALALHEDGTLVTPAAPARRGELLTLYGTGFGPLAIPRPEGLAIPPAPPFPVVDVVTILLGEAVLPSEAAFAAPGRVAVDVVQFRVPSDAPSGGSPLRVRIGAVDSNTVQLPVE